MGEAEELRVCSRWAPMIGKPEIITGENWISPENNRMRMLMSFSAYTWLAKTNVLSLLPSHFHLSVTLLLFPSPSPGLCPVFLLLDFSHLLPASLISFFFLSPLMFPSIPQRASRFTHILSPRLSYHLSMSSSQKRKTTTISVEVKKSQHKYIIGPKGNTLQEILEATGVSVEMPPLDSSSETIILRGEPDKLGPALTQVYAKVRTRENCN